VTSHKKKSIIFGVSFHAVELVDNFQISFLGGIYRYGGNEPDSTVVGFDYSVMTVDEYKSGGWGVNGSSTTWVPVPQLSFSGNVSIEANHTIGPIRQSESYSYNTTTSIKPGLILQLRWTVRAGSDGLGINDFEIVTTPSSSPQRTQATNWWKIGTVVLAVGFLTLLITSVVLCVKLQKSKNGHNYNVVPTDDSVVSPPTPTSQGSGSFWNKYKFNGPPDVDVEAPNVDNPIN